MPRKKIQWDHRVRVSTQKAPGKSTRVLLEFLPDISAEMNPDQAEWIGRKLILAAENAISDDKTNPS